MLIIVIYFALVFLSFAFCESSKRIGLFLPLIWFILFFTAYKYFINSNVLGLLVLVIGLLAIIIYCICVIESLIRVFSPGFDFLQKYRANKLEKHLRAIGRFPGQLDMYSILPVLKNNQDYEIIYNHCKNGDELCEFTEDWKDYFLDLQSTIYMHPDREPDDLYFNFDEWYKKNERWKDTSYHHIYYKHQEKLYNSHST